MGKTVLIVDDALFMRRMLRDIVEEGGYKVVGEAENGQDAIKRASELNPDIVLMDIVMPDLGGIEALKKIQTLSPQTTVIMCSAMGQKVLIEEALQAGAANFIIKPFQPAEVLEVLKSTLSEATRTQ